MILTKLDHHVIEMKTTAGKKFQNFVWSRFLIIVQNVNMVTNGKRNSRLNPLASSKHREDGAQRCNTSRPINNSHSQAAETAPQRVGESSLVAGAAAVR